MSADPKTRPNVITIICDDLRDTIDGIGGHPQLKTPHLDRLCARGTRFTNAHCTSPLCAPARAALWCGLYPHRTGNYSFAHWRENAVLKNTVPVQEHFQRGGYRVFGTGKVNHNGQEDLATYDEWGWKDEFGPWPWRGTGSHWWVPHPDQADLVEATRPLVSPNSRTVQGLTGECSYGRLSNVPVWSADPNGAWPGHTGWRLYDNPFQWKSCEDRDLMPDERNTDWAIDVLEQTHENPFLLMVGFNRPHTPYFVPDEYFDRFPLETLELPPVLAGDLADCRADAMRTVQPYGFDRYTQICTAADRDNWLRYIQAYLASVAFIDDQIGRLLDALDASPHAENTAIVFTADHGYHLGEKDYIFKDTPWETSTRIPLVVCPPRDGTGARGTACDAPVSHIDVYPTLIDMCGLLSQPNTGCNNRELDGHSLRPVLDDPSQSPVRDHAVTLCGGFAGQADAPGHINLVWTLRDAHFRYIRYHTGEEELYDHRDDPREWNNRIDDPELGPVKKRLAAKLEPYRHEAVKP